MTKIAIIIGSTRAGRNSAQVADWVLDRASRRDDAEFEIVDLRDYPLPHFDEEMGPMRGAIETDYARAWGAKVAEFDGFVFVTPEYNHSTTGVLKNALDYLYAEWNDKAAGFVGFGGAGGSRAIEHLRLIAAELRMATVRNQVGLSIMTDFEGFTRLAPAPMHEGVLDGMLDQVVAWAGALAPLRTSTVAA